MIRSGPDLATLLETCLTRMDAGSTIDDLVNEYAANSPKKAEELRELLLTAQAIRPEKESLRVPASAQIDSRKRFLDQAQALQQQPGATSRLYWLRFWRVLQQHAGSMAFTAVAILLIFIAFGSTQALPGDSLYPVKLAAEQASISLSGSPAKQEDRESVYDSRRAEEVAAMIRMKRSGAVSFGGYLNSTKEKRWQVTGINLQMAQVTEQQAQSLSGVYVEIKGYLDNEGTVQVDSLAPRLETLHGTIASMAAGQWTVGDKQVIVTTHTQVTGIPQVGRQVSIQVAQYENSKQVLAISVQIAGETETAEPTTTMTATARPTIIQEPTMTAQPQPTINAKPIPTNTPQIQDSKHTQPGGSTSEPEDNHENSTPENGGDHQSSGGSSGDSSGDH